MEALERKEKNTRICLCGKPVPLHFFLLPPLLPPPARLPVSDRRNRLSGPPPPPPPEEEEPEEGRPEPELRCGAASPAAATPSEGLLWLLLLLLSASAALPAAAGACNAACCALLSRGVNSAAGCCCGCGNGCTCGRAPAALPSSEPVLGLICLDSVPLATLLPRCLLSGLPDLLAPPAARMGLLLQLQVSKLWLFRSRCAPLRMGASPACPAEEGRLAGNWASGCPLLP